MEWMGRASSGPQVIAIASVNISPYHVLLTSLLPTFPFFQVIQAFRDGSLPTNKQIDEALLFAEKHSPVDVKKLSPDGRRLVDDVRDIIETARLQILTKNKDELFQNFIAHTQAVSITPFGRIVWSARYDDADSHRARGFSISAD